MIERVENRGLEEPLELEGTEDEFSKKSKIKYTRALLLELTEVEVCHKLPSDFDLLVLRQLDEGSEATVEQKSIFGTPFDHTPFLTTTWPFPDQRWEDHMYTGCKESHLQRSNSSERQEVYRPSPQKPEEDAGVLHCEIQKCGLFQLSKSENPYRPPHLKKQKAKPLETFSKPGVEYSVSGNSDKNGSADDNTISSGLALAGSDGSTNEPVRKSEAFRRNNGGNEAIEPSKALDDYDDFWRKNEGNMVIGTNNIHVAQMKDNNNHPTFDDFWAEILETIHLQQEPRSISPRNTHADSDLEIHFPDEENLISVGHNNLNFDESNDAEAEISLPDEDSLIQNMIAPYSSSGSWEADKVKSNIAVDIRKNSKPGNVAKRDDRSKRFHHKAQRYPSFTGLLPHSLSQTSMNIFSAGFCPLLSTPDIISYMPTLTSFAQSDIYLPHPNTKTNNPISHYSVSHQPNNFPQQPTFIDPMNGLTLYDVEATRLHQQAIFEGLGKPEAGK